MDNPVVGVMKTTESILKTHTESIGGLTRIVLENRKEIEKMKKVLEALIEDTCADDARDEYHRQFGERLLLESDLQS